MTILSPRPIAFVPAVADRMTSHVCLRSHRRDLDLYGRLFTNWQQSRRSETIRLDDALDDLEAQLAQIEEAVTMAVPSRPATTPSKPKPGISVMTPLSAVRI